MKKKFELILKEFDINNYENPIKEAKAEVVLDLEENQSTIDFLNKYNIDIKLEVFHRIIKSLFEQLCKEY